LDNICSRQAWI